MFVVGKDCGRIQFPNGQASLAHHLHQVTCPESLSKSIPGSNYDANVAVC